MACIRTNLSLAVFLAAVSHSWGATESFQCTGVDDTSALQDRLDVGSRAGGGTVELAAGAPCQLASDLNVPANMRLVGNPRAVLDAAEDGRFEVGIVTCAGGAVLEDLSVDSGHQAIPALACTVGQKEEPVRLARLHLRGNPPADREPLPKTVVAKIDCERAYSNCLEAEDIRIDCDGSSAVTGLRVQGVGASSAHVDSAQVVGCLRGVVVRGSRVILENSLTGSSRSGSVGLDVGASAIVQNNMVVVNEPMYGIRAGEMSSVAGNKIVVGGGSGVAVQAARRSRVTSNLIQLDDVAGARGIAIASGGIAQGNQIIVSGGADAIGMEFVGQGVVAVGNSTSMGGVPGTTHYLVSSSQNIVSDNSMSGGDWGVRPRIFEAENSEGFTNGARLTGNNMIFQRRGCAVMETGWHATDNHCNWLGKGGAGFWIGSPGEFGSCSSHTLISNNTIHSSQPGTALVRFESPAWRCLAHDESGGSSLRACGPPRRSCSAGSRCKRVSCRNISISNNLMMQTDVGTVGVDFFSLAPAVRSLARVRNVQIRANTLSGHPGAPFVRFRVDQPPRLMEQIIIEDNLPDGKDRLEGWKPEFSAVTPPKRRTRKAPPVRAQGLK